MHLWLNLLLLLVTLAGGALPLLIRPLADREMNGLLAFSGAFLLGITLLHLAPESFGEVGSRAGLYMLVGFFLQLAIQRITHGAEHGHTHLQHSGHIVPAASILAGLSVHAAMEGLPLGFHYRQGSTEPALYLAVAAHKLPEAMLAASLAASAWGKQRAWIALLCFSLVTPLAGSLATVLGIRYNAMAQLVSAVIPIVAGAFLHIATTIFYESGTRQHHLTFRKILAILVGLGAALATLAFE
jgi:zinc transporter ZupT